MSKLANPDNFESMQSKLGSASFVGHVTTTEVNIWVRVYREGDWRLFISDIPLDIDPYSIQPSDPIFSSNSSVQYQDKFISSDTGQTHTFKFDNLLAGKKYYYYLMAVGELYFSIERKIELGIRTSYVFKTDLVDLSQFSFGFYSCHDPFGHRSFSEGLWPHFDEQLRERNASFVIGGGDQMYCDTHGRYKQSSHQQNKPQIEDLWDWLAKHKKTLASAFNIDTASNESIDEDGIKQYLKQLYRTYYRIYWNTPAMLETFRKFPQYMIWDDHEIMDGWGSLTKSERANKLDHIFQWDNHQLNEKICQLAFKAASEVYLEYQHNHNPSTPTDQWDYSFIKGETGFYVLDMRGHHDVENNDGERLLGKQQMARLIAWLKKPETIALKAVFIVSPVPVVHWNDKIMNSIDLLLAVGGTKDDAQDEWGNDTNITERNLLLGHLGTFSDKHKIPVTFLSGDVHCASAFKIHLKDKPNAKLMNITSSGISRKPAPSYLDKLIEGDGPLYKHDTALVETVFSLAGKNNFLIINVNTEINPCRISVTMNFGEPVDDFIKQKVFFINEQ